MTDDIAPELLAELRDYISKLIAAGFADQERIAQWATEYLADQTDYADQLEQYAYAITPRLMQEQLQEQRHWPAITDNDRLDGAFLALEEAGIVAAQNFTCCMTCGSTEIWERIEAARERGSDVRGYVFYHSQDTERAVEGGGLYLAYGATSDGPDAIAAIGQDIVTALRNAGLAPTWNGSPSSRISLPLTWQRRRSPSGSPR